jgi:hypothetical protein
MISMLEFCQISFCFHCMNNKLPAQGFQMPIFSKGKDAYIHVKVDEKNSFPSGLTPHIYRKIETKKGLVIYDLICCSCELILKQKYAINKRKKPYQVQNALMKKGEMSIEKWEQMAKHSF